MDRGIGEALGHQVLKDLAVGAAGGDVDGQIGRGTTVVAHQGHEIDGFTGAVDAALGPEIGVQRAGMGLACDAAIRKVEGGAVEVEGGEVLPFRQLGEHMQGRGGERAFAA